MAKVFAADTAVEASLEAMKGFRGNGYSKTLRSSILRDALTLIRGTGKCCVADRATGCSKVSRPSR